MVVFLFTIVNTVPFDVPQQTVLVTSTLTPINHQDAPACYSYVGIQQPVNSVQTEKREINLIKARQDQILVQVYKLAIKKEKFKDKHKKHLIQQYLVEKRSNQNSVHKIYFIKTVKDYLLKNRFPE